MGLLKGKFAAYAFWKRIEGDIAVITSDLPEPLDDERKTRFIAGLRKIRNFLIDQQVNPHDLKFIDDEIIRHTETKQISLYREEDDQVPPEVVDIYAYGSSETEGMVAIHLPYNFEQSKRLTNGVYKKTGLVKFYIGREKSLYGKVVVEVYDYAQDVPIATLVHSTKKDQDTDEPMKKYVALFGDKIDRKKFQEIKQIRAPLRVYRFISDDKDYYLLSSERLDIGDYIVTGMIRTIDDLKQLTDSSKLQTKLPFFFAQSVKPRVQKYASTEQFFARMADLDVREQTAFNHPFTTKIKVRRDGETIERNVILKHPTWYKWFIWAWLTHSKIGMNPYPLHIFQVGPPGCGKSAQLNALFSKTDENRSIFSGAQSTLKNLVPSFHTSPAKPGYLAECNRFAFCDELLRCVIRTKSGSGEDREEGVGMMNDLLEHMKREAGSGVSKVGNLRMTSRVFSATNPVRGINCMDDVLTKLDPSFCSRWLFYYPDEQSEHVRMIRRSVDADLPVSDYDLPNEDFLSIIDYLQGFNATYDMKRVTEIYESLTPALSEVLKNHYDTRHKHHIECVIDGIVKTRCLLHHDERFCAIEQDYRTLSEVWGRVVGSWIDASRVKNLPIEHRVFYLPEMAQYLYWHVAAEKKVMTRQEVCDIALKGMTKTEYISAHVILRDNGLLIEDGDGTIRPHFLEGGVLLRYDGR